MIAAALAAIFAVLVAASYLGDASLRRSIERRMNASLKGYSASIGHAHLSVFGLSIALRNVVVRQEANPEPPVLELPFLKASVHWREILTLHLVADFLLEKPRLNVNRPQLTAEAGDAVPVKERGWQQAFESIYPLKINLLRIDDGSLTYVDAEGAAPIEVTQLRVRATNIRNIHSKAHVYPSPVEVEGRLLGSGRGTMRGHANFLAEPFPGVHLLFDFVGVPLAPFRSVVARSNLLVKGGVVATHGELELAPDVRFVRVEDLGLKDVTLDFLHTPATTAKEQTAARVVKKAAHEAAASPITDLRIDRLKLEKSEIGFVNKARDPAYRVFLSGLTLTATNLSSGLKAGPAAVKLSGRFMGSGPSDAHGTFRPDAKGADFDVAVSIRDTDMRAMNDLLRAYGKFDVTAGVFSFYSELAVRNGTVDGYVKPLFRDMQVYDARQDAEKSFFHKLYEKLVGGVAKLLENRERNEVATKTPVSGPISSPHTSTTQVVLKLIENAFFRAILPGFDAELARYAAAHGRPAPKPAETASR